MRAAKIINTKPEPGAAASYVSHWSQPAHETFAIIAYLPNLDGNGHLLLLQGLDVAGTQAAAETLIHPEAIDRSCNEQPDRMARFVPLKSFYVPAASNRSPPALQSSEADIGIREPGGRDTIGYCGSR
jgi:hypothetical protein